MLYRDIQMISYKGNGILAFFIFGIWVAFVLIFNLSGGGSACNIAASALRADSCFQGNAGGEHLPVIFGSF